MSTRQILKKPDSRREWFRYQLRLRGSSYSAIAREVGITRQAVYNRILTPSPRVAEAVAAALGREKCELWPARFNA